MRNLNEAGRPLQSFRTRQNGGFAAAQPSSHCSPWPFASESASMNPPRSHADHLGGKVSGWDGFTHLAKLDPSFCPGFVTAPGFHKLSGKLGIETRHSFFLLLQRPRHPSQFVQNARQSVSPFIAPKARPISAWAIGLGPRQAVPNPGMRAESLAHAGGYETETETKRNRLQNALQVAKDDQTKVSSSKNGCPSLHLIRMGMNQDFHYLRRYY